MFFYTKENRYEDFSHRERNAKGGVGKTTVATWLSQGLALMGKKVLVIDNDKQHNATTALSGGVNRTYTKTVRDIYQLQDFTKINDLLIPSVFWLAWLVGRGPQGRRLRSGCTGRCHRSRGSNQRLCRSGVGHGLRRRLQILLLSKRVGRL